MNGMIKVGVVLAGYAAALLAAYVTITIRQHSTQGRDVQASAGMYAFGDGLVFLAVFGVVAILSTALALYFLRPRRSFWAAFSTAALAFVAAGVLVVSVLVLLSFWRR